MPSHMAGATAGSARTLAASPASGTDPKWYATRGAVANVAAAVIAMPSQRPSRSARDREPPCAPWPDAARPGGPREPARRSGANSSATRRSLAASGRPASRMPATATNESCQPGSPQARGFRASVAAAASSSAYQRDDGRESVIAAIPAAPITPARCSDGPAPASGT